MSADPRTLAPAGTGSLPGGLSPSLLRPLAWCVSALLIASSLLPLVPRLVAPHAALTLQITGDLSRVDPEEVRLKVAPRLNTAFYDLDLAAVKADVESLPWVARARVERAWPSSVRVQVWEHRAVARWGEKSLLSSHDVVFTPPSLDGALAALPRLAGPDGQQAEVRQAFEALRGALAGTPFAPVQLVENARGEWLATTQDGIELRLGRGAPMDAVARLAGPVSTALAGRLTEVSYVDLHYINGFAVGWRGSGADGARSRAGDGAEVRRE